MRANPHFLNKSTAFWGYAKLISEQLGYSKANRVLYHDEHSIRTKLHKMDIDIDKVLLKEVAAYLEYRANLLNNTAKDLFMDVNEARQRFNHLFQIYQSNNFTSSLPLNKQKGDKRDYAYFTCMINIITEDVLREFCNNHGFTYGEDIGFDDDPRSLTYILNQNSEVQGILSRRFDGAFPSTVNPRAIWEIKEYYYTTTFGSRIADGVYETQLDGHEVNHLSDVLHTPIEHIYFIDDYNTWWNMGRSYLCRIIDMLHMGLVDEVIFGREIFERWPESLNELLYNK
ncbi:DUF7687 domain-containing protein [Bacillus cereus]|uniref:DUF7687 domain-containing protein n=1 Tax=Bacillus cereus TaxID=1396 RepID=UPI00217F3834|nr:hypothetical protein [Bacillus cereus]UWJ21253.1 hypothetical protein FORC10_p013 [Bacillus cereus]